MTAFSGAKAAILIGDQLLITLRDDRPDIPWPNLWDFPGGGREADESPEACLAREVMEEVGLEIAETPVLWRRQFAATTGTAPVWFFVLQLPAGAEAKIRFGDEGQCWQLISPGEYLTLPDAIPHLQERLRQWMVSPDNGLA